MNSTCLNDCSKRRVEVIAPFLERQICLLQENRDLSKAYPEIPGWGLKNIFWPVFGVHSTQNLVERYNTHSLSLSLSIALSIHLSHFVSLLSLFLSHINIFGLSLVFYHHSSFVSHMIFSHIINWTYFIDKFKICRILKILGFSIYMHTNEIYFVGLTWKEPTGPPQDYCSFRSLYGLITQS